MNKKNLLYPYTIWIAGFTVIPILILIYFAFTVNSNFTLENFAKIPLKPLYRSILYSVITTIICILLTYPLSIILSKIKFKNKDNVIYIFILPMWINFLLRTMAWQTLLEKKRSN